MISGAYRLPATVCAFGLPRYTPTDVPPWSRTTRTEPFGDDGVGLVPGGFGQRAVATDQRPRQPVGIVVEFGEARALRADEALAEHVVAVAAGAGHPAVVDRQRQAAGGLAKGQIRRAVWVIGPFAPSCTSAPLLGADYSCSYTFGSSVPM